MKTVIVGTIFVLTVLSALFVLTEGSKPSTTNVQSQPTTSSSDKDFKDLKIQ